MAYLDLYLHLVDTVHTQFLTQKNLEKGGVTPFYDNWDPLLNPIVAWAKMVRQVMAIPGATMD